MILGPLMQGGKLLLDRKNVRIMTAGGVMVADPFKK